MCRRLAAFPIFHVLRAWFHLLCRGVDRKREKRHKKRESVISGLSLLYILYFFSCIIFSLKMIFSREIKIRLAVVCVHIRIGEISSKSLNVRENNDGESVCGLIGFRKKRGIRRIYKKWGKQRAKGDRYCAVRPASHSMYHNMEYPEEWLHGTTGKWFGFIPLQQSYGFESISWTCFSFHSFLLLFIFSRCVCPFSFRLSFSLDSPFFF